MMHYLSLALVCVLGMACCKDQARNPAPPPTTETAITTGQPATAPATKTGPALPTAKELLEMIDQATRIEAKSGIGEKPTWSKDLTPEDINNLKTGIGQASFSSEVLRCAPTVLIDLYQKEKKLAELAGFCSADDPGTVLRFNINGKFGSLTPQDMTKINQAFRASVDQ